MNATLSLKKTHENTLAAFGTNFGGHIFYAPILKRFSISYE